MTWLLKLFGGGIAQQLREAYEARLRATTTEQKYETDIVIAQLEARRDALRGSRLSGVIQGLWALPFIIYTWKLIVYDKILRMGTTDPLGTYETWVGQAIVSFYFLTVAGRGIIRELRR